MVAWRKKFRPKIEGGILRLEEYIVALKGAEPAPSNKSIEWSSSLLGCPVDVVLDIATPEGLDVSAECSGLSSVLNTLPHVSFVSLLETHCTTSV